MKNRLQGSGDVFSLYTSPSMSIFRLALLFGMESRSTTQIDVFIIEMNIYFNTNGKMV